jgi:hypothetical protein
MENFVISRVDEWESIAPGVEIEIPAEKVRRPELMFNTNGPVEVWVTTDELAEPRLVAASSGLFRVKYTVHGTSRLIVVAPDDTVIFVRGFARDHFVNKTATESYTVAAPQQKRNSDLDRMIMLMQANEKARQNHYDKMLKALENGETQNAPAALSPPKANANDDPDQVIDDAGIGGADDATS